MSFVHRFILFKMFVRVGSEMSKYFSPPRQRTVFYKTCPSQTHILDSARRGGVGSQRAQDSPQKKLKTSRIWFTMFGEGPKVDNGRSWASPGPHQGPFFSSELATHLGTSSKVQIRRDRAISDLRGIITGLKHNLDLGGPFKPKRVHPRPERIITVSSGPR